MTTSAKQQRSRISNVLKLVVTDIHFTNASETMNKIKVLIWEFEQGYITPYKLVEKLKEIIDE